MQKYRKLLIALAAVVSIWLIGITGIDGGLINDILKETIDVVAPIDDEVKTEQAQEQLNEVEPPLPEPPSQDPPGEAEPPKDPTYEPPLEPPSYPPYESTAR